MCGVSICNTTPCDMNNCNLVLIADSGSTKTAWCLKDGAKVVEMFATSGVNPSVQNEDEIEIMFVSELMPHISQAGCVAKVFFYGAGCTPQRKSVVNSVFRKIGFTNAELVVESDMLGAARAVCGDQPGVIGILGTGSNSCKYDGVKIVDNTPSLGFILGDEGGGAYIGKRLVSDCMKGVMPERISKMFIDETGLTIADIVQKVYRESSPNRFLAGLSRFCAIHIDEPEIHLLLVDCFEQFFRRNILRYDNPSGIIHLVGSIAEVYREQVEEAAGRCSLTIGRILRSPIDGLVDIIN